MLTKACDSEYVAANALHSDCDMLEVSVLRSLEHENVVYLRQ